MSSNPTATRNLSRILPALLTVSTEKGRVPMSLTDYFPFEDTFSIDQPARIVHRSSRQIAKTTSIIGRLLVECAMIKGRRVLIVTPLQEQSDTLSNVIVRPMIDESPIRYLLSQRSGLGSVRTRIFDNGSMMFFSYAKGDTLRLRSKTSSVLLVDEAQSMDISDLPVVESCLRASTEPRVWVSGTSTTKDTYLENEWNVSSQGIWHTKCHVCGVNNIFAIEPEGHLLKIMERSKYHDNISEKCPGTVCRECGRPISPRYGRWVHRYPERLKDYAGYHAPQPIFPIHYAIPIKWRQLLGYAHGQGGYTTAKLYNECYGEAYDMAYKLVSIDDIKKAAVLNENTEVAAIKRRKNYRLVIMGVDWGGGGDEGISRTKGAVCGFARDGGIDVFFGFGFQPSTDRVAEAMEIKRIAEALGVNIIAHDIGGGIGTASEAALTHLGWPADRIVRMLYRGAEGTGQVEFHKPSEHNAIGYHSMHKSKTLQFLSQAIKYGKVRFYQYDYKSMDEPGHLHDFLSLVEDKIDTPTGGTYRIRRATKTVCDDFSAAVNYGSAAAWELMGWPNLITAGTVTQS